MSENLHLVPSLSSFLLLLFIYVSSISACDSTVHSNPIRLPRQTTSQHQGNVGASPVLMFSIRIIIKLSDSSGINRRADGYLKFLFPLETHNLKVVMGFSPPEISIMQARIF